jgi:hypothetical protein
MFDRAKRTSSTSSGAKITHRIARHPLWQAHH